MIAILEGDLWNQEKKQKEKFYVRSLTEVDFPHIRQVQTVVLDHLENKESLQPLTTEEYQQIFSGNGLIIGVWVQDVLIAFRALLFPGDSSENLGRDLEFTKEEQMKVVHQEISCVIPAYRGNGLQKKLATCIMELFSKLDSYYRYLCCTVHPSNFPSLKDKLIQGMIIAKLTEKYQGNLRYILYKDLLKQMNIHQNTVVSVPCKDLERQKQLLDKGYYGFQLIEDNNEPALLFGLSYN